MGESVEQGFPGEFSTRLASFEARLGGLLDEMSQLRAEAVDWQAECERLAASRPVPEASPVLLPQPADVPISHPGDAAIRATIETLIDRWRAEPPAAAAESVPPVPEPASPIAPPAADLEATMILSGGIRSQPPQPSSPEPGLPADRTFFDAEKTMVFSPAPPKAPPAKPSADAGEITLETVILAAPPPRPSAPQPTQAPPAPPPAAPPAPPPAAEPAPPSDPIDLAATVILAPRKPGDAGRR